MYAYVFIIRMSIYISVFLSISIYLFISHFTRDSLMHIHLYYIGVDDISINPRHLLTL